MVVVEDITHSFFCGKSMYLRVAVAFAIGSLVRFSRTRLRYWAGGLVIYFCEIQRNIILQR